MGFCSSATTDRTVLRVRSASPGTFRSLQSARASNALKLYIRGLLSAPSMHLRWRFEVRRLAATAASDSCPTYCLA
jgi:hypothetical protein